MEGKKTHQEPKKELEYRSLVALLPQSRQPMTSEGERNSVLLSS